VRVASYNPKDVRIELYAAATMSLLASADILTPGGKNGDAYNKMSVRDSNYSV
jgi:hypothetical protein